eukprot:12885470-Prorocentrum_lima.AAC.1
MTLMLPLILSIKVRRLLFTPHNKSAICSLNATLAHNKLKQYVWSGSWQNTCTCPSAGEWHI